MKIPVNTCDFKIDFELKHEAGHYLKVKYDWINVDAATNEVTFPEVDSGFLRDWTLIQIEGEEPISIESSQASIPPVGKQSNAKAAAAKGKPAAAQKGQPKALEEITDNRPRIIKYSRDCAEECGGVGLEVSENVAIAFSQAKMKLEVFSVDRETQEETLIETI